MTRTPENAQTARTVAADKRAGSLDITTLILAAILIAAGFILNYTVGNALAISGIKPQFIIAAYCLAILLARPSLAGSAALGLVSAAVIQLSTSIPGLNFVTEAAGALTMAIVCAAGDRMGGKNLTPLVGTFVATLVSGGLFAVLGTVIMQAELATILVKVPTVLGTAVFNAVVVQALAIPLSVALKRR